MWIMQWTYEITKTCFVHECGEQDVDHKYQDPLQRRPVETGNCDSETWSGRTIRSGVAMSTA